MMNFSEKQNITIAQLENGERVRYDLCASNVDTYNPELFKLIGKGFIYSYNGIIQIGEKKELYFFKRK